MFTICNYDEYNDGGPYMKHEVIDLHGNEEISFDPFANNRIMSSKRLDSDVFRKLIYLRNVRRVLFDRSLFFDPAWDILLDLTAATLEGKSISVSSTCIAAEVPTTTAIRWIRQMVDQDILVRTSDPSDGRRSFLSLSEPAMQAMITWGDNFSNMFTGEVGCEP